MKTEDGVEVVGGGDDYPELTQTEMIALSMMCEGKWLIYDGKTEWVTPNGVQKESQLKAGTIKKFLGHGLISESPFNKNRFRLEEKGRKCFKQVQMLLKH